jgi:hypothetical protein
MPLMNETQDHSRISAVPHMTAADKALVAAMVAFAVALFFLMPRWLTAEGREVQIRSGERLVGRYPLDRDRTVEATGPLGVTVIRIEGGEAKVIASPCPHKLCIKMGEIGSAGGVIACVPNEVVISIGRGTRSDLDAVSR